MGKVAFAKQMTDEVLVGIISRLYCDKGAGTIRERPHPTSLCSATFPKGEGSFVLLTAVYSRAAFGR